MSARHEILGGRVQLFKRPQGRHWHAAASLAGKQFRVSTRKEDLTQAEDRAEEWYLELRGKLKRNELGHLTKANAEKTFREAGEQFLREFPVLTEGQRSAIYTAGHERRIRKHLIPFFGDKPLSEITGGLVQEYRIHRIEQAKALRGKPPARTTMHQEIVCLRQTLKTAMRHRWLTHLPDLSEPYRSHAKVSHRAWFSPEEYRRLYNATRKRANRPIRERFRWECEQLHDTVLFLANTGLRPDEAFRLEYRDVSVMDDEASGETILLIEVRRGKRGSGFCKSTSNAVRFFQRMRERNKPQPNDKLFPTNQHELLNRVLEEEGLKFDRDGQRRTFYSLRHTYICLRLMEGADIYQIAKNCRTSVEMIEKFYASHIHTSLNAAAINVKKSRPDKKRVDDARRGELAE